MGGPDASAPRVSIPRAAGRGAQPPCTTYVLTASSATCRDVHGNDTHFSWLNSRVWSLDDVRVGSIDSP